MMLRLAKLPLWAWIAFCIGLAYATWNPSGWSAIGLVQSQVPISIKVLALASLALVIGLLIIEAFRNVGVAGMLIQAALFGAALFVLLDVNVATPGSVLATLGWWIQAVLGVIVAVSFQGARIWRVLTGRVSVTVDDPGHHHA